MFNFTAHNPVQLHFGKNILARLGEKAAETGKRALLVYGGGSVKRNGSLDDSIAQLEQNGISMVHFDGIRPNPILEDVEAAIALGNKEGVDMVVAVGGGSVIDSAKVIATCLSENCSPWDLMKGRHKPASSLPLIAVLTLAATGTEMNASAVLQNKDTREKIGFNHPVMYPVHSFLDPGYTLSVPAVHTAYGIVDLVAHCLEAWFGKGEASLSDRFVIAVIKEAMEYGPALMQDLQNYELRANIMWAATNALNNITTYGRFSGDWGVHRLGHDISFLYDTPHGATLSMVYPAWLSHMKEKTPDRIEKLVSELFGTTDLDEGIEALKNFFRSLGSPVELSKAGIDPAKKKEIIELMNANKAEGMNHRLSDEDRAAIMALV